MATVTSGRLAASPVIQTEITAVPKDATAATRNVSRGPTTLFTVLGDNQKAAAGNTQVWVKLFDTIANSWTPGTTQAVLGFPLEAYTSADDSQALGTYQLMHSATGARFEKGISISVSKEAGDAATADAGTDVRVDLTHS